MVRDTGGGQRTEDQPAKPVVLVLVPHIPVGEEWVIASAQHHRVVAVDFRAGRRLKVNWLPQVHPSVRRAEILIPRYRPSRWLWPANARVAAHGLVSAIDGLSMDWLPTVAHGHFFASSSALPILRRLREIPYVVSEHSSSLTGNNPEKVLSAAGRKMALQVYAGANAVLPVSSALGRDIADLVRRDVGPVIPNPIDCDMFEYQRRHGVPRVVAVARLEPVKRLSLLLEAMPLVLDSRPDMRLTIVGDGSQHDSLKLLARNLGLGGSVHFPGWLSREDVAATVAGATVFAMTSYTENTPVAALEAASTGVPVVGPHVGGIPELIDRVAGTTFTPGSRLELANALLQCVGVPERERLVSSRAVRATYDVRSIGERLKAVYENAVGNASNE